MEIENLEAEFLEVKNLEVDIINYEGSKQFEFLLEYFSLKEIKILTKRLDTINENEGWEENIKVFIRDFENSNFSFIYNVGDSKNSYTKISIIFFPENIDYLIKCSSTSLKWNKSYETLKNIDYYNINNYNYIDNVKDFNHLFNTDIISLPHYIFAVGIKDKIVYKHHHFDGFNLVYEIGLTIEHIVNVYLKNFNDEKTPFYFLISTRDGYMENMYSYVKNCPHIFKNENDYFINEKEIEFEDDKYPLLHKNKYILGQNVQINNEYIIAVPDRYYFCLNKYNKYRSIYLNIRFSDKKPKLVYAGKNYGSKYNFFLRKDIQINQREYFKSIKDKISVNDNLYVPEHFISIREMIEYKYILDIDGNAGTWDATAWKLNSNSVIFKTKSVWKQWFFEEYKEWVHYIPINEDFTDIQEKINWCENNQEKCIEITKNCRKLFKKIYLYSNVEKTTKTTIEVILNEIKKENKNVYYLND